MVANCCRHADSARFCQSFEPGRNIDSVPVDVPFCDDDVAKVDPNPEYDPLFLARYLIAVAHPALDGNRASDGLNNARELDQETIPGRLDDASFEFGYLGVYEFAAMGS